MSRQLRTILAATDFSPPARHAALRIVEQEQERDCDLVVVGKHGHSAAEELLLGSVTRHVLDEGACDVLVSTAHDGPEMT